MDLDFHGGLAAILVLLLALSLRGGAGVRRHWILLTELAVAVVILTWAGRSVVRVIVSHGRGIETSAITLLPRSGGVPLTVGGTAPADVILPDPHLAPVHLAFRWEGGEGDPRASLLNLSLDHRVEIDGQEIHDVPLLAGTVLHVADRRWTVQEGGFWPGLTLHDGDGQVLAVAASGVDGVLQKLPGVARRPRTLGWLEAGDDGGLRILDDPPLPSLDPILRLELRAGVPWLRFPEAADRMGHILSVTRPGEGTLRPGDRYAPLREGQILGVGRARYLVSILRSGAVRLRPFGAPPRTGWPEGDQLWGKGATAVALRPEGDALRATALDPSGGTGFARVGRTWSLTSGGPASVRVQPGDRLTLGGADSTMTLVVTDTVSWSSFRAGSLGTVDGNLLETLTWVGSLVLLLAALLSWSGQLHLAASGIFHGALVLAALGLLCLVRLSDPEDPQRAEIVLRQARTLVLGLGVAVLPAALSAFTARPGPVVRDRVVSWLDGARGDGRPAAILLGITILGLLCQLPFGEQGIAIPGLGSVQPMEAARLAVVLFLVRGTARAIEDKRERLRGREGWRFRLSYLLHALPIAVVCLIAVWLDDDSPVLLFAIFVAVLYAVSILKPSWSLWPPSLWPDHIGAEALAALGVAGLGGTILILDPEGTIATRIRTWWDPWGHGGENWQAVSALWASAQGGLWGLGWSGANGALPPAVKDDFILALLAARTGAIGVGLCAAVFSVFVLSAVRSAERLGGEAPVRHERASLLAHALTLMFAIQAAIVLGSATGGLPVMGQPLPFVAAAGSHTLLFCIPAVGLLLESCRRPIHAPSPVPMPEWEGSVIPDISSVGD